MNRRRLLQLGAALVLVPAGLYAAGGRVDPATSQGVATAAASAKPSHDAYDALLKRYVVPQPDGVNRVDYTKWKTSAADIKALKDYISTLAATPVSKLSRNEAFAYWANLYNAITLDVVLGRFPVASIRDIKSDGLLDPKAYTGPWRTKRVTVEGKSYSLDDIENEAMRPVFKDPRVHYSVNCASVGCPNLLTKAWRAETLDIDLDVAASDFINHPRGVEVVAGNKARVSSIYKWFRDDFGPNDAAVIAHFKKYAKPELSAKLDKVTALGDDHYDWALSVVGGKAK